MLPTSSFLPAFIAGQPLYGMEYRFGQFGSAIPSQDLLSPVYRWRENVGEPTLMPCQCCSAVAKILLWYQNISSYKYKHSSMRAALGKINSISVKSQYNCLWNCLTHATQCNITAQVATWNVQLSKSIWKQNKQPPPFRKKNKNL